MAILQSADQPAEHLLAALEQRQMTRAKGKLENVRRRHNYIPMIVALLTALQEKQQLDGAVEKAKLKAAEQQTKKQNAGK
jgi:ubiquitin carboxyl-terminal hydrolase L5